MRTKCIRQVKLALQTALNSSYNGSESRNEVTLSKLQRWQQRSCVAAEIEDVQVYQKEIPLPVGENINLTELSIDSAENETKMNRFETEFCWWRKQRSTAGFQDFNRQHCHQVFYYTRMLHSCGTFCFVPWHTPGVGHNRTESFQKITAANNNCYSWYRNKILFDSVQVKAWRWYRAGDELAWVNKSTHRLVQQWGVSAECYACCPSLRKLAWLSIPNWHCENNFFTAGSRMDQNWGHEESVGYYRIPQILEGCL